MIIKIMAALYVSVMAAAFYATSEYNGGLPALPVSTRYAVDVLVIGMGILWMLAAIDFEKLKFLYLISVIMIVPIIGIGFISMMIWIIRCQETSFVVRGTINVICLLLNILCAASSYYMFGKKAVVYMLIASSATVLVIMLDIMRIYGLGSFLTEYASLLTSFADNTGPIMKKMEFHDLTQGFGVFMLYYLCCMKNRQWRFLEFLCAVFFFSTGLKRIDVVALLIAFAVGIVYDLFSERMKIALLVAVEVFFFLFAYLYLYLIKRGWYKPLMDHFGIDMMSRDYIYDFFKDFYELSPTFLGFGIRYIYKLRFDYKTLKMGLYVPSLAHNEFMTHFIELGFWGFIYWLWSNTWYKISAVRKKFGSKASTFMLLTVIYSFITYITDNTFFYYSINIVSQITVIAYVDEYRQVQERSMP